MFFKNSCLDKTNSLFCATTNSNTTKQSSKRLHDKQLGSSDQAQPINPLTSNITIVEAEDNYLNITHNYIITSTTTTNTVERQVTQLNHTTRLLNIDNKQDNNKLLTSITQTSILHILITKLIQQVVQTRYQILLRIV